MRDEVKKMKDKKGKIKGERPEGFTPGPWKYDPRMNEILNDDRYPIAEYVLELENGNLIAAAPEMYAALKDCIDAIEYAIQDDIVPEHIRNWLKESKDTADKSLQKARGEE